MTIYAALFLYATARLAWMVLLDYAIPRAGLALAHLEKA